MQKTGSFISNNSRFIPLAATVALTIIAYAVGAFFFEGMRDPQVFLNLFRTSPFLLISAVGMTFVILSGGIDLSVSGVVALTTVASAALIRTNWDPWVVMLLMLVMGTTLGTVMGLFITYMKVQPFIATLAGMWFARGMCFFISDDAISIDNRIYRILGQTKILIPGLADPVAKTGPYISILVVLMLLVLGVAIYVAHYTRFGRTIYAIGGNEQSARLMGLPVNRTKVMVYALNGFCSALAGITLSIYVSSGHGLYAQNFELDVIASVVMGGTMLTGGAGYIFGTLFGVLITGITQTLIQFNGQLSSWWTRIVIGALTLIFIGVQSLLAAQKNRQLAREKMGNVETTASPQTGSLLLNRQFQMWAGGIGLLAVAAVALMAFRMVAVGQASSNEPTVTTNCTLKPFRQEQAASLLAEGAVIVYERNGGVECIDELYSVYADGRIVGDDGMTTIEKQVTPADVTDLLSAISGLGWFTNEMYSTSHTPCGQCFTYFISVNHDGQQKTIQAVNGGTDAPANYWQVVALINALNPHFTTGQ